MPLSKKKNGRTNGGGINPAKKGSRAERAAYLGITAASKHIKGDPPGKTRTSGMPPRKTGRTGERF